MDQIKKVVVIPIEFESKLYKAAKPKAAAKTVTQKANKKPVKNTKVKWTVK